MQILDLVREETSKNEIKKVIFKEYNALRKIFRSFSKHQIGAGLCMNLLSYYRWARKCSLVEKGKNKCNITKLDNIFRRVNIEENLVFSFSFSVLLPHFSSISLESNDRRTLVKAGCS